MRKNQPEEEYEEAKDQSGVFKNLPEVQHHTTNDEEGITNISKGIINVIFLQVFHLKIRVHYNSNSENSNS